MRRVPRILLVMLAAAGACRGDDGAAPPTAPLEPLDSGLDAAVTPPESGIPSRFPSPVVGVPAPPPPSPGPVLRVGAARALKTLADASSEAVDGSIVELDPGTYTGDVSTWHQNQLTIRGADPKARPVIDANGASAGDKATLVLTGDLVVVENLELRGARSTGHNGAGIRHEGKRLIVRRCRFVDNEDGILAGDGVDRSLEVYDSEFVQSGFSDGMAHHVYANQIDLMVAQGDWFHQEKSGHLFKSRARETRVLYNRLTDETGTASYELDLPNGGVAYVIGNLLEQTAKSENPAMIRMGEEGVTRWTKNELWLVNNTVVSDLAAGLWVQVAGPITGKLANNVFAGDGAITIPSGVSQDHNINVGLADLIDAAAFDYRLKTAPPAGSYADPGVANGLHLLPVRKYVHPASSQALSALPSQPGAIQP